MRQLQFTNDAKQHQTIVTEGNKTIDFTLYFSPRTQAWYFDLIYGTLKIYGCQFVNGFRLLRQWKNLIDFDFSVMSVDNIDPFQLSDFAMNRTYVFLLNSGDIEAIEKEVYYE